MRYFEGHAGHVFSLAFSPDGRTLASGDAYQTVRLWDVASGETRALLKPRRPVHRKTGVHGLAYHPEGHTLAAAGGREVTLWDAATRKEYGRFVGHATPPRSVAFAPDGALVSGGRGDGNINGDVILWDRKLLGQPERSMGFPPVQSLAVSPDGQAVALGTFTGAFLWMPQKSPAGGLLRSWDVLRLHRSGGTTVSKESESYLRSLALTGNFYGLAFSPDGGLLATAEDNGVGLWDPRDGRRVDLMEGHTEPVLSVVFSPDGRLVASGGHDGSLRLWDVDGRAEVACRDPEDGWANAVTFSPDGLTVAVGVEEDIILWDVEGR